jgi:hypothetical protein
MFVDSRLLRNLAISLYYSPGDSYLRITASSLFELCNLLPRERFMMHEAIESDCHSSASDIFLRSPSDFLEFASHVEVSRYRSVEYFD